VYNAHVEDLIGWRTSWLINRRRTTDKYWYLLDRKLADEFDIVYFADATQSSLIGPSLMRRIPFVFRWMVVFAEVLIWSQLNMVPISRLKWRLFFSPSDNDVAITFGRRIFHEMMEERAQQLARFGHIFCHLGHCYANTTLLSQEAEKYRDKLTFVAEARLDKNSFFFQTQFPWYTGDILVVPFVPQRRFQVTKEFDARKNQAVSTGTYHLFSIDPEYGAWNDIRNIMGVDSLHPLRRKLDERKQEVKDLIEVRNSFFWESLYKNKDGRQPVDRVGALLKKWYARFRKLFVHHQVTYFQFDIVELYNSFRFSIVVEEVIGQPGVGAMESMACGCAYIGQSSPIYSDIGMVDGVHYIGYDGTFDGLRACVEMARSDPERARRISEAGRAFVADRCNPHAALGIYRQWASRILQAV
jgi:hypothetical protein